MTIANTLGNATESQSMAMDSNALNGLKRAAQDNSPEAIKKVAKQFEAVFVNMVLKSMREATSQDSPFDNEQSRTFTSMLDQQLSQNMSERGIGLADVLTRQLTKTATLTPEEMQQMMGDTQTRLQQIFEQREQPLNQPTSNISPNILPSLNSAPSNTAPSISDKQSQYQSPVERFNHMLEADAKAVSRSTGIPAHLMLGQAALETGWGKREIKAADGSNSFNLFGIKATGSWTGKVASTTTTEYINGVKQTRVEKFRAYDSYAESFADFAKLMQQNPRYQHVMNNTHDINGYANAMQQAGYATDPNYANKLASVIKKVVSS